MYSAIVKIYGNHVINGNKQFEEVPTNIRETVKQYIEEIDSSFFAGHVEDVEIPDAEQEVETPDTAPEITSESETTVTTEPEQSDTTELESESAAETNVETDLENSEAEENIEESEDVDTSVENSEIVEEPVTGLDETSTSEDIVVDEAEAIDTTVVNEADSTIEDTKSEDEEQTSEKSESQQSFVFSTAINNAADGDTVTLTEDVFLTRGITISKPITIDLNNHFIMSEKNCLTIDNDVTITGVGGVYGGGGGSYTAVTIKSGTLTINGGHFSVGPDENNEGNSTIYINGDDAHLIITDGTFETEAAYKGQYYVINKKNGCAGTVLISGGTFINYDPSTGDDADSGDTFVDDDYIVIKTDEITFQVVKADAILI